MRRIDKQSWPRRDHYDFFAPMSDPFYTLSFPVEVTALRNCCKARGLSFYHAMVYGVTKAMESVEAFHYKDRQGEIVYHERLVPSFTHLESGSELFRIITLDAGDDMADFCRQARAQAAAQTEFITQGPWDEDALDQRKGSAPLGLDPPGSMGAVGGAGGAHLLEPQPGAEPPPAGRRSCGPVL